VRPRAWYYLVVNQGIQTTVDPRGKAETKVFFNGEIKIAGTGYSHKNDSTVVRLLDYKSLEELYDEVDVYAEDFRQDVIKPEEIADKYNELNEANDIEQKRKQQEHEDRRSSREVTS